MPLWLFEELLRSHIYMGGASSDVLPGQLKIRGAIEPR